MIENKIPFHKPYLNPNVNITLKDSIESGWLTTGPKVKQFENQLKEILNSNYVVCVNSCTAALHLSLLALDLKVGSKFIAPTYTFVSTVEVGQYIGLEPVLVDSDNSYNLDLNKVEQILKKDTHNKIKVIIPVHFAGLAVDMKSLIFLAEKYNLYIIEDAAHALEGYSNIGKIGNTNFSTAFSFYANKNITTGGEGGAISTNDKKMSQKIRKLSLHGMNKDGWKRFSFSGKWAYDISELGCKYNMTDISASFGLDQLNYINDWHKKRLKIVKLYNRSFKNIDGIILPQNIENKKHSRHLFIIRIIPEKWKISRNELIVMLNQKGIGTSVHYIPVHMHSYYVNNFGFKNENFPNAYIFSQTVLTLPLYPLLKIREIDYIINTFNELWISNKK